MAKALTWKDFSEKQLQQILEQSKSHADLRMNLGCIMMPTEKYDPRSEILLDMYFGALIFAQDKGFSAEKASTLISIVKVNHVQAVGKRLTFDNSWKEAKDLLLMHSVHRPPFSIGIFSLGDLQDITEFLLNTYYRHYKLYQYAFCPVLKLNVETSQDDVEISPSLPLLNEGVSQEDWDLKQQYLHEEEEVKRGEDQRIINEASSQLILEVSSKDEVTRKVTEKINHYVDKLREDIQSQMQEQEEKFLEKLSNLLSKGKRKTFQWNKELML